MEHQPFVVPLDGPSLRDQSEALGPGLALGVFHVDAQGRGVLDEVLAAAAVDPDLSNRGVLGSRRIDQEGAPATESCTLAPVTRTVRSKPSMSVTMLLFLLTIFLAASVPWSLAETLVVVFTFCASITPGVHRRGAGDRPPLHFEGGLPSGRVRAQASAWWRMPWAIACSLVGSLR